MNTTTILYSLLAATLAFLGVTTVRAKSGDNQVNQTRKVEPFHSIDITAVGEIIFTQSDTYSLRIEGKERLVNNTTTTVADGTLAIGIKNKKMTRGQNNSVTIHLTAPSLEAIEFKGVGSFRCSEALKLDGDLDVEIKGVGEVNIDNLQCRNLDLRLHGVGDAEVCVDCEHVEASLHGVGSVTLRGHARAADLHKGGIGDLNTGGLEVEE